MWKMPHEVNSRAESLFLDVVTGAVFINKSVWAGKKK